MASVKVKFRPSAVTDKEGTIYYQIIHNRVIRQIKTDYRVFEEEWNEKNGVVILSANGRTDILRSIKERIGWDLNRLKIIIGRMENNGNGFTADDIVEEYQEATREQSFFQFMEGVIARLKQLNRERTAENYAATLKSFMRFQEDKDVLLDEIGSDLMMEYESYRRRKTGQQLFIIWEKCMQEIFVKYQINGTDYLLPIIKETGSEQQQYRNALRLVNSKLKEIATMAELQVNLTMYVSRHS